MRGYHLESEGCPGERLHGYKWHHASAREMRTRFGDVASLPTCSRLSIYSCLEFKGITAINGVLPTIRFPEVHRAAPPKPSETLHHVIKSSTLGTGQLGRENSDRCLILRTSTFHGKGYGMRTMPPMVGTSSRLDIVLLSNTSTMVRITFGHGGSVMASFLRSKSTHVTIQRRRSNIIITIGGAVRTSGQRGLYI